MKKRENNRSPQFIGMLPDTCLSDPQQHDLFSALGELRSPFSGISDWPWIDECFAETSERILQANGEEEWRILGGEYDDRTNRPYVNMASELASRVVQETSDTKGGFLWMNENTAWAVRLSPRSASDKQSRFAFCVSWEGSATILDKVARLRVEQELSKVLPQHAPGDRDATRSQLREIGHKLRLFHRAEQLLWTIHAAVLSQRSEVVLLPDVTLGQVIWGGDRNSWPRNWRRDIMRSLCSLAGLRTEVLRLGRTGWNPRLGAHSVCVAHVEDLSVTRPDEDYCRPCCPMTRNTENHRHFIVQIGHGFLGVLNKFAESAGDSNYRTFDFNPPRRHEKKQGDGDQGNDGRIISINLPAKVFGPASWTGLSTELRRVMHGVFVELTRSQEKSRRNDPQVYHRGRVPSPKPKSAEIFCPLLLPEERYVCFGGNGRRHGLGYRVVGGKGSGWLFKCGYEIPAGDQELSRVVRAFMRRLSELVEILGIVVAAVDPKSCEWFDLDLLRAMSRQRLGGEKLDRLHLRIYAPEDYQSRLRDYIADRGGFAEIPGDVNHDGAKRSGTPDIQTRMRLAGVKHQDLADHLGKSRTWVTRLVNGDKPWPTDLEQQVEDFLAREEARISGIPDP